MISPFRVLQQLVLSECPDTAIVSGDSLLCRLAGALAALRADPGAVGESDIAGLIRQGILRCSSTSEPVPDLRVPRGVGWPGEATWGRFGCEATPVNKTHTFVRARAWTPGWLDPGAASVIEAALREEPRRRVRQVPLDPRVAALTGYATYASPGQREAVRAAFLMPAGSTLVASLPTGAGKTLAFQLPALTWAPEGGLTLVVVPTVALARDQAERFGALLERRPGVVGGPFDYHGGLNDEAKASIRAGVRAGALPILFTSPEAALGALRAPLFEAARRGRLRYFVVDEAHMVAQWGQQFRPEFQSLAGLRDALLTVSPPEFRPRTLLLTATLTTETLATLDLLFGRGALQIVSEAALRPEPGFLLSKASSEAEREERVLEAIRHLPRPIILYSTLRKHAERWFDLLLDTGFRRVRLVRGGDLDGDAGERILREWQERGADIVVATSAFGLGIDQTDVRSIVHACMPETIDRYYQEVGRAGRDGNASVALLVSVPRDDTTAKSIAEEKLLSVERAFERWESMWARRRHACDEVYVLSLDALPSRIDSPGDYNASWNLRTLVLMAHAGLLEFAAHEPPALKRAEDEDDDAFELRRHEAVQRFRREIAVRLRDVRHSDQAHWDTAVSGVRAALRRADQGSYQAVVELHSLTRPLNDMFRDAYTLANLGVIPPRLRGSCPVTRSAGIVHHVSADPEVTSIRRTAASISPPLSRALDPCRDHAGRCWISYEPPDGTRAERKWHGEVRALLRHLVAGGVIELALPGYLLDDDTWDRLVDYSSLRFLLRASPPSSTCDPYAPELPVPRLTLIGGRCADVPSIAGSMQIHRPLHILVLPRHARDPRHPGRNLLDIERHLDWNDLLARLET
ncbi:protein DpdF [Sorangium sp. So ce291]|uniref:protein DpdF n=1 Tax=Sorangium sp. So ce291 TaxID=3133294 RepID=UPI003F62C463